VADMLHNRILKFTNDGTLLKTWGVGTPRSVATDADGNVYVGGHHRMYKFTSEGGLLTTWGSYGGGDGQFTNWLTVATDTDGNVYVADTGQRRIQKFTSDGTFLTKWGSPGIGDSQFHSPSGIATDEAGNVYVADWGQSCVKVFRPVLNRSPVAVALANGQADITLDEQSPSGTWAALDGSQSSDPDGDDLAYEWDVFSDGIVVVPDPVVDFAYPLGGPYTATLTVTDPHGESDSASVTITIVPGSPWHQLANLQMLIGDYVLSGDIEPEIEGPLLAKVNAAMAALDRGDPPGAKIAMNDLKALINQVEAQADKKITREAADAIIARANQIIADLGG